MEKSVQEVPSHKAMKRKSVAGPNCFIYYLSNFPLRTSDNSIGTV